MESRVLRIACVLTLGAWVGTGLVGCDIASDPNWTEPDNSGNNGWDNGEAGYGNIPGNAERGASQSGRFTYTVPHEGTIWVGNDTNRYLVVKHNVRRGDRVEVDPRGNRVKLNDEAIYQQNMEANARHSVYYREAGSSSGGSSPYGNVPSSAENMSSGSGKITWRAESSGHVWIGNDRQRSVVVDSNVNSGDLVEVDPRSNRVKVNGREIYSQNMESKHTHSIFFQEGHKGKH